MTPEEFAKNIMKEVVDSSLVEYRNIYETTQPHQATDPYWQRALTLYMSLSAEQREVLFQIIRQISVDTTSHILGILDGSSYLEGADEEFNLSYGLNNRLNGDLQDYFLALEEDK